MTLTPFSRSQEGSNCWKMACLHPIFWMNGWILTKLAQLYCWNMDKNLLDLYFQDMEKNLLDLGDLDPIFKVTLKLRFWKVACLNPISWRNGWILTRLTQLYCCYTVPWPHVQVHTRSYKVWAQIQCILLGHGLIWFGWPWRSFQGHTRS